jgi:hypothetical protein
MILLEKEITFLAIDDLKNYMKMIMAGAFQ